jgi:hypothetical protein
MCGSYFIKNHQFQILECMRRERSAGLSYQDAAIVWVILGSLEGPNQRRSQQSQPKDYSN